MNDSKTGIPMPQSCMVYGCTEKTEVIIWVNGAPVSRCAEHYDKDLRRAGKNQFRVDESEFRKVEESSLRGRLAEVLKEIINAKRLAA
jgi:hypothetical protein